MQSRARNKLFLALLISPALLLLHPQVAHACSCGEKPTVLEAFEHAETVVIAQVVSVEKTDHKDAVNGVLSTKTTVERVFKGGLKVGEELTFGQGGGADCIWTFDEESVGERFLFYLRSIKEADGIWLAGTCGRSRSI